MAIVMGIVIVVQVLTILYLWGVGMVMSENVHLLNGWATTMMEKHDMLVVSHNSLVGKHNELVSTLSGKKPESHTVN